LLAEVGRSYDKQVAAVFSPKLREDNAGLDGFTKSDLIGKNCTL